MSISINYNDSIKLHASMITENCDDFMQVAKEEVENSHNVLSNTEANSFESVFPSINYGARLVMLTLGEGLGKDSHGVLVDRMTQCDDLVKLATDIQTITQFVRKKLEKNILGVSPRKDTAEI